MKNLFLVTILMVVLSLTTLANINTEDVIKPYSISKLTLKSLIQGINSDNFGLKVSSAQRLGELKISEGVIPLMSMLRNDDDERARIAAALALIKIGDARGLFAVKQAAKFDDSERVRAMCEKFYLSYQKNI